MLSYTNIEQSRKLREILPLETADGGWYGTTNPFAANTHFWLGTKYSTNANFPAWSLTALYSILPNTKHVSSTLSRGGWEIEEPEYIDKWWCEYEDNDDHTKDVTVTADKPIDACYELILKLHELKLL